LRRTALIVLVAALGVSIAARAPAQAPSGASPIVDPRGWAAAFFRALQQQPEMAYDIAKAAGLQPAGAERMQKVTLQLQRADGAVLGIEAIGEEHLGRAVLRLSYLALHQRGAALYHLLFYRPPQAREWQLYGMEVVGEPNRFPFTPGPPAP
jgi:hypothetical protein